MMTTTADEAAVVSILDLRRVRGEFLTKSSRLYVVFYALLATSTFLAGVAQLLVYEEKHFEDVASRLDLAAMTMTFLSTIILQILAISGIKAIAHNLNKIGRLINLYLSPFLTVGERKIIVEKIIELSDDVESFWVTLPKYNGAIFHDGLMVADKEAHNRVNALLLSGVTSDSND